MFCTYLTIYKGKLLPPFYIGSSTVENVQKGYHGSVKSRRYGSIWKEELRNHPENFVTKIISLHENRLEAFDKEEKFHRALNVIKNPLYINLTFAKQRFSMIDGHKPGTGAKIGAANRGKKMPPRSAEYAAKQRAAKLGKKMGPNKPRTEEEKRAHLDRTGRKVILRGVEYISVKDAMIALGVTGKTIRAWEAKERLHEV